MKLNFIFFIKFCLILNLQGCKNAIIHSTNEKVTKKPLKQNWKKTNLLITQ